MDCSAQGHGVRVAIFGAGRVGTAMSLEMPGVPVVKRGEDLECDVACICWPAQAVAEFADSCPLAAKAHKVAFCNGVWGVEDGADSSGICYVHALELGDRAKPDKKSWRVEIDPIATVLTACGLGVTKTNNFDRELWTKNLFLIPLAVAALEMGLPTKKAAETVEHKKWYDVVKSLAVQALGEEEAAKCEPRVKFLLSRVPSRQLIRTEEAIYFRACLQSP